MSRVTRWWAGLEICPYQDECRWNPFTFWYYPWDVASGCIWHEEAVVEIVQLAGA